MVLTSRIRWGDFTRLFVRFRFDACRFWCFAIKTTEKKREMHWCQFRLLSSFSVYKFMVVWIRCSWRIVCVRRYSTLQVETHHSVKLLWLLKPEYSKFQAAMSVASERYGTCCSLCYAHLVSNALCKHVCSLVISLQFQCPLLDSLCDEVNLVIGGFYFFCQCRECRSNVSRRNNFH